MTTKKQASKRRTSKKVGAKERPLPTAAGQTEFKGKSSRARRLLASQEGRQLDFKETIDSVDTESLVAMANTQSGGTILVGVKELKASGGRQQTKVVGCGYGDGDKLRILQRANDCSPPVHLEIFTENLNSKPFLRIEIPASEARLHCNKKGTYKIRKGARNHPLPPNELLKIYLETEKTLFVERFRHAATGLEKDVARVRNEIGESMSNLRSNIAGMDREITLMLEEIYGEANQANALADESQMNAADAASLSADIRERIEYIGPAVADLTAMVTDLMAHHQLPSATEKAHRQALELVAYMLASKSPDPLQDPSTIADELAERQNLGSGLELPREDLEAIAHEACEMHFQRIRAKMGK